MLQQCKVVNLRILANCYTQSYLPLKVHCLSANNVDIRICILTCALFTLSIPPTWWRGCVLSSVTSLHSLYNLTPIYNSHITQLHALQCIESSDDAFYVRRVLCFVLAAPVAQTETVAVCQSCFSGLTSTSDKIKASQLMKPRVCLVRSLSTAVIVKSLFCIAVLKTAQENLQFVQQSDHCYHIAQVSQFSRYVQFVG